METQARIWGKLWSKETSSKEDCVEPCVSLQAASSFCVTNVTKPLYFQTTKNKELSCKREFLTCQEELEIETTNLWSFCLFPQGPVCLDRKNREPPNKRCYNFMHTKDLLRCNSLAFPCWKGTGNSRHGKEMKSKERRNQIFVSGELVVAPLRLVSFICHCPHIDTSPALIQSRMWAVKGSTDQLQQHPLGRDRLKDFPW